MSSNSASSNNSVRKSGLTPHIENEYRRALALEYKYEYDDNAVGNFFIRYGSQLTNDDMVILHNIEQLVRSNQRAF